MVRPTGGGSPLRRLNMGQLFIVLAIVSFIVTFLVFRSVLSGKPQEDASSHVKTRPLVVATASILAGEVIDAEDIQVVDWPEDHYPSEVYEDPALLTGRVAGKDIIAGEPLFRLSLAGESSRGGLPVIIPKGMRAMTILVTENKGVAGFVKPGDRVDLVGNFEYQLPEETRKNLASSGGLLQDSLNVSKTVLQDIQVLAIAQEMYEGTSTDSSKDTKSGDSGGGDKTNSNPAPVSGNPTQGKIVSSVTLAVTPEQAEILSYADARGDLRLTLRGDNDRDQTDMAGTLNTDVVPVDRLFEKMLGGSSAMSGFPTDPGPAGDDASVPDTLPVGPYGGGHQIEVIEGTERSSVSF